MQDVTLTQILAAVLAAFLILGVSFHLRSRSRSALVMWLVSAGAVPYWFGLNAVVFIPWLSIASLVLLLALWRPRRDGASAPDRLVLALAGAVCLGIPLAGVAPGDALVILGSWIVPYFAGRLAARRLAAEDVVMALAWFGILVGAISIVEYAADFHPFVGLGLGNQAASTWHWIQYRGGVPRSEWVFGHSIALGNVIAICIPFIYSAPRMRASIRVFGILLAIGGVALTFSRSAIVAAVVGLVIAIVVPQARVVGPRLALALLVPIGAVVLGPMVVTPLLSAAGELAESTAIRLQMLSLLPTIKVFGASGTYVQLADGQTGHLGAGYEGGAARTVDNSAVLLGLNAGWIPVVLFCIIVAWAALKAFGEDRSPAAVAVASQVGTIMTVAMITQYGSLFWFTVGLAFGASEAARTARSASQSTALGEVQNTLVRGARSRALGSGPTIPVEPVARIFHGAAGLCRDGAGGVALG